ncbi:hypothetical protein [Acholeplasma laidlawii]|jgi:hypothetical protein|uniref:Uncharacterized protein n=3 Tax=Acholeplasma laidlawii TaxID=2148 RepID=A9NGG9_ACHLI|nr:hypothetical protein [Acholeplasma laidlawii]ABX81449.1 hypothetical protein ACL_0835 [Acholeplasma laidlawii PG-8A]NWH09976.1 hypothetical protein [Acholeplasma laidlawii]NWH11366.1 hypothetical protein [Acholeplasma laidlawii]NWH13224.1 hypothetical protein [Acholeplasma laidlawii]OAN17365.1 hypothetical protein A2I99_07010 [Acholeplasma laidlawii]
MSVTWFNGEPKEIVVTITPINLTVNKSGVQFFEFANQVMLGYDKDKDVILIRPLSKDDVLRGDIPEHTRYNISVNASYGRIANKAFISRISTVFELVFEEKGTKFKAVWNKNSNILEVRLKEVL